MRMEISKLFPPHRKPDNRKIKEKLAETMISSVLVYSKQANFRGRDNRSLPPALVVFICLRIVVHRVQSSNLHVKLSITQNWKSYISRILPNLQSCLEDHWTLWKGILLRYECIYMKTGNSQTRISINKHEQIKDYVWLRQKLSETIRNRIKSDKKVARRKQNKS